MRCAAIGCNNTLDCKKKYSAQIDLEKVMKLTFYAFPCDPVRKATWIRILGLENKTLNSRSYVCILHFKEKFIDRRSPSYPRLRGNAIPHVLHHVDNGMDLDETEHPTFIGFENVRVKVENDDEQHSLSPTFSVTVTQCEFSDVRVKVENDSESDSECCIIDSSCDKETNTSSLWLLETQKPETQDKATNVSFETRNMNSSDIEVIETASSTETAPVSVLTCDKATNTSFSLLPETRKSTEDKATSIPPEKILDMNSSEATKKASNAKNVQLQLCKKVQNLKRQLKRKDKKITSMRRIIKECCNMI